MLPLRDHERSGIVPWVTIGFIALNVLAFLKELAAGETLPLFLERWALVPSLVDLGQPLSFVPFVTHQFLHAGLAHIAFNMWYLWIFGDNIEARLGHARFFGFYLLAGIVAAVIQFAFLVGSDIPMLGASGAVAGVLGAYLALFPHHRVDTLVPHFGFWTRATLPAGFVLFFWFIIQLFSGLGSLGVSAAVGGVAFWAHVGGFAFGWLVMRSAFGRPPTPAAHRHLPRATEPEAIDLWK